MVDRLEHTGNPALLEQGDTPGTVRRPWRLKAVKAGFLVAFAGVVVRLVEIQIVESPKYQEIAQRQYDAKVILPATRGNIYDRNGNVLASHSLFVSFAADPKLAEDRSWKIADRFSRLFGKPRNLYLDRLRSEKRFVWLERQVRPEFAKKIAAEPLPGVVAFDEPKRLYHYPGIGGALVGFTDIDNSGLSGVELQFDKYLRGTDGYIILQRDGRGQARPSADYLRVEPVGGSNVFLTIDLVYQSIAEEKLKDGVLRANAESGLAIMQKCSTGEILAVAQYPPLDQSRPASSGTEQQKLRAVTDMFEPGSVFKIVTASAALENGLVAPQQRFNAEHGTYTVQLPDGKFRVIRDTHENDILTFREAVEVSSNIVMAKISDLIGAERLFRQARAYGFGIESGVEYPGEAKGELKRPALWSGTTLNTMAYGYEVAVTPLQILSAYGALANNGVLMKPTLVKRIVSNDGAVLDEMKPEQVRSVVSASTAATLKSFFEGVVDRGTGTTAKVEGVRIAGKTGTSRKYFDGKYETDSYTASFVGFFPVEQPEVVCLVMLDNPRVGGYTGGAASAPIFKEIVQRIIATGRVRVPTTAKSSIVQTGRNDVMVPDVKGLQPDVARELIESRGLSVELYGEGIVARQVPSPGTGVEPGSNVMLVLNGNDRGASGNAAVVPDLRGMSVRRAVNRLAIDKLQAQIQGSGIVVSQVPAAGRVVAAGASILLVCEPPALAVRNN